MAILGMLAVAGCAPQIVQRTSVQTGPVPVTVEGQAFSADLRQGRPGRRLTEDGALPTAGLSVTVARPEGFPAGGGSAAAPASVAPVIRADPRLGDADGRLAKGAARAACAANGGRFDPAALGRVSAPGRWTFDGACS